MKLSAELEFLFVKKFGNSRYIDGRKPEITSQFTEQQYIESALPWLWVTYPAILLMTLFFSLMFSLCTGIIIKRKAD